MLQNQAILSGAYMKQLKQDGFTPGCAISRLHRVPELVPNTSAVSTVLPSVKILCSDQVLSKVYGFNKYKISLQSYFFY